MRVNLQVKLAVASARAGRSFPLEEVAFDQGIALII